MKFTTRTTLRHTLDGYVASTPRLSSRWGQEPIHVNVQTKHIAACRKLWKLLGRKGS